MAFHHNFDGPRLIRPEELRASQRLSLHCFGHSLDHEMDSQGEIWPAAETYLIACQGVPVSQISVFHTRLNVAGGFIQVGSIGGVCTHPEYRGQGLASRLLEHSAWRLAEDGARLLLISGDRGLYTRSGCPMAGKYASYILRPGQLQPPAHQVCLRSAGKEDAPLCSRLYASEQVHFERPISKFEEHFARPRGGITAEEWVVEMEGQPAAYLFLRLTWASLGHPEAGIRRLHEFAGSRAAIAAALAQAMNQFPFCKLLLSIPGQDSELIQLLTNYGARPKWIPLPEHTMRILDFPALMADLRPYLQTRLDPAVLDALRFEQSGPLLNGGGDRYSIFLGAERLDLNGEEMTFLVMGSPGRRLLAVPRLQGKLAKAIAGLFPLPSFLPGLDYH